MGFPRNPRRHIARKHLPCAYAVFLIITQFLFHMPSSNIFNEVLTTISKCTVTFHQKLKQFINFGHLFTSFPHELGWFPRKNARRAERAAFFLGKPLYRIQFFGGTYNVPPVFCHPFRIMNTCLRFNFFPSTLYPQSLNIVSISSMLRT